MADTTITIGAGDSPAPKSSKPSPARANLDFPEKGEVQPDGFYGIDIKGTVTVVLTGKVTRLEDSTGEYGCKCLGLDIDSCRIEGGEDYDEEGAGLGYAVERTRQRV
jgi:hypothetical protein